jgi:phage baseplate assembly protein gpV
MTLFGQTAAVIYARIAGRLTVNAAGTLAVQAAQNAAHADTTSVYIGSWATFTKVS